MASHLPMKPSPLTLGLSLGSSLLLTACASSLDVRRAGATAESRVGIPFPMAMSQYDIAVNYQLVECSDPVSLLVSVEVQPPKSVPDHEHLFMLDPGSISGALKTGSLDVTYHPSGSVATVNAKVEDRSAQVIAGVASLAISVATYGAVQPAPAAAAGAGATGAAPSGPLGAVPLPRSRCKQPVADALKALDAQTAAAQGTALLLDQAVAALKVVSDKAAAMGANADEATKKALSAALDSVTASAAHNHRATEALGATLGTLSYAKTFAWPERVADADADTKTRGDIPDAVLAQWIERPPLDDDDRRQGRVHLALASVVPVPAAARAVEPRHGLPMRIPVMSSLSICRFDDCSAAGALSLGPPRKDEILQMGYVTYLPCVSRPFSSVECGFDLLENGRIKSIGSKNLTSTLEGGLGALKSLVDAGTERRKIKSEAELKRLEAETALLKARQENLAASQALQADPLAAVRGATAAATARADYYNAQRAEREAEAALAEALLKATGRP